MAYMSQDTKSKLAPAIKAVLKKYGVKGTLAVRNHSTLVLNIKSGKIDFFESYNRICGAKQRPEHLPFRPANESIDVNTYWYHEQFDGAAKDFLEEMIDAMKGPEFFDHSDIQTDYFHLSHYIYINIGHWQKAYVLEK